MTQEQEARERRAARNQSLFRDLNERIGGLPNKGVTTRELPRQEEAEELAFRFVQLARPHAAQANRSPAPVFTTVP